MKATAVAVQQQLLALQAKHMDQRLTLTSKLLSNRRGDMNQQNSG
jgi:hypothetical protein